MSKKANHRRSPQQEGFRAQLSKKAKSRHRRRALQLSQAAAAVSEEASDSGSLGGYAMVAMVFGVIGSLAGAVDGYGAGGLPVALICMPIFAVFAAVMGVVAVFLRGLISVLLFPGMIMLIVYVVVSQLIWDPPDTDQGPDTAIERIDDAVSGAHAPAIYVS